MALSTAPFTVIPGSSSKATISSISSLAGWLQEGTVAKEEDRLSTDFSLACRASPRKAERLLTAQGPPNPKGTPFSELAQKVLSLTSWKGIYKN
jgi:hypothetical protein